VTIVSDERVPYENDDPCRLILRDHLAIDRTVLANERTFLAYIRTALTLLVVGASFIKFFDSMTLGIVGWSLLPFAAGVFAFGMWRYGYTKALIRKAEAKPEGEAPQ
jgi:putative membrane protein